MKISIIIPVYNVEHYLDKCLKSVINQTYNNLEIIIINDGSTDNSAQICKRYQAIDDRITLINNENMGLSESRNIGIKKASGDFIMFLDSDDWLDKETCKKSINLAIKYDTELVFWSYIREYKNVSLPKELYNINNNYRIFEKNEFLDKFHRKLVGPIGTELRSPENAESIVTAWGKLYKTLIIKENKIQFLNTKEIGTEDMYFNLIYGGYVNRAVFLNEFLSHYRRDNLNSLTRKMDFTLLDRWKNMYSYIEKYIIINNLSLEYKEALNNRIILSIIDIGMNIVRNNNLSRKNKIYSLNDILRREYIINAYSKIRIKDFDLKWCVFFIFAKNRVSYPLYYLLKFMIKMTNH